MVVNDHFAVGKSFAARPGGFGRFAHGEHEADGVIRRKLDRYNTQTRRLTARMFLDALETARNLALD
jgi:hypothetical protein